MSEDIQFIGFAVAAIVVAHLAAIRANDVRHWTRWVAFVSMCWLAVQAWPTYQHSVTQQAKKLSPLEAGVLQLIANKQRELHGETKSKAEADQDADHRNAGG